MEELSPCAMATDACTRLGRRAATTEPVGRKCCSPWAESLHSAREKLSP